MFTDMTNLEKEKKDIQLDMFIIEQKDEQIKEIKNLKGENKKFLKIRTNTGISL